MSISIRSFFEVHLTRGCLLVLDIDETILKYDGICKQWWKDRFAYHHAIHNNYDLADSLCLKDWKEYIKLTLPSHTDADGFFDLIKRANKLTCKVMIVTARDDQIKEITHEHLNYLNVTDIDVYFVAGGNKGLLIDRVISENSQNYDGINFVDDMDHNLHDVKNHFGDKVTCYKFEIDHHNC